MCNLAGTSSGAKLVNAALLDTNKLVYEFCAVGIGPIVLSPVVRLLRVVMCSRVCQRCARLALPVPDRMSRDATLSGILFK